MTADSYFRHYRGITTFNNTLAKVSLIEIYTTYCASQLTLSGWVTGGGAEETQAGRTAMMT